MHLQPGFLKDLLEWTLPGQNRHRGTANALSRSFCPFPSPRCVFAFASSETSESAEGPKADRQALESCSSCLVFSFSSSFSTYLLLLCVHICMYVCVICLWECMHACMLWHMCGSQGTT